MTMTTMKFSNTDAIQALSEILDDNQISVEEQDLEHYGKDWSSRVYSVCPIAIVFPKSTQDVQNIVLLANKKHFKLVPSGGRTGHSGGAVAAQGEVVVSFEKMNAIKDFNPINASVTCQAGVVTQKLQEFAENQGLFYPVNFGSAGSSHIGGNIATNAGGIKVIRYGNTREWVLGLTVVTGNGDILEFNKGLKKNNTGYDFRHLFIGSEGTLGFITEAQMQLTRPPKESRVLFLASPNLSSVMKVLGYFQTKLELSAFEFFTDNALQRTLQHRKIPHPLERSSPVYALVEIEICHSQVDDLALALLEKCMEESWVLDGIMSQSENQSQQLWSIRESIPEAIAACSPYRNDISVRVSDLPSFIDAANEIFKRHCPQIESVCFGHVGDGNVHLNLLKPDSMEKDEFYARAHEVVVILYQTLEKFGGSVSAEHGIGYVKKQYLIYSRSEKEIEFMKQIKTVFDPNGVVNPGKIFD